MKNKWKLIASIFQIAIGALAVLAFFIAGISGENMVKWTVTLLLSIGFIVLGVIGIFDYKSGK